MDGSTTSLARPAADTALVDWVRHYAAMVVLVTILGALGGVAWGAFTTPRAEMWSIVVDTEQVLPARQLGVVAETLFRAEETYRAVISDLGLDWTPDRLFDTVQLRSVPESRLLIVAATGDDRWSASIVSDAMARSLADAFRESGYPGFVTLGAPQPPTVSTTVSLPVFGALGASVGFLAALGIAVLHLRMRRPMLCLGAAISIVEPTDVISVPGRWSALGMLRHLRPPAMSTAARDLARGRLDPDRQTFHVRWPGSAPKRATKVARALGLDVDPDAERTVVVADAGSRWRDLEDDAAAHDAGPVTLLWLA